MDKASYEQSFRAEYRELSKRHKALCGIIAKHEAGIPDDDLPCSISLLSEQCAVMGRYLSILETRAIVENIELKKQ